LGSVIGADEDGAGTCSATGEPDVLLPMASTVPAPRAPAAIATAT
jgi:hypothetical protein